MIPIGQPSPEFLDLLHRLLENDISDEDFARVQKIIASDENACYQYLRHIHLHGLLHWTHAITETSALPPHPPEVIAGLRQRAFELPEEQPAGKHAERITIESDPAADLQPSGPRSTVRDASSAKSEAVPFLYGVKTWGSLALTAGLVTVLLAAIWLWPRDGGERGRQAAQPTISPRQDVAGPERLLGIGKVRVDSGTVRLQLPQVGKLVVDGPADLELLTPMRLRLDRGRIRVLVTEPKGHGFVVVTNHGEVTDLGTEFGVDASDGDDTDLVVFQGTVDLRMAGVNPSVPFAERLLGGEGIRFGRNGAFDRIMSIHTGDVATFERSNSANSRETPPVILKVSDNLHVNETKKFYEIIRGGFGEDARAYVDRPYQWNGINKSGIPKFLQGADYVKTFNDYKQEKIIVAVELSRPADLYLFWDARIPPSGWLKKAFRDTGLVLGLDQTAYEGNPLSRGTLGVGPGILVDYRFSIWHRTVPSAGTVTLGSLTRRQSSSISMYGIAAVAAEADHNLNPDNTAKKEEP